MQSDGLKLQHAHHGPAEIDIAALTLTGSKNKYSYESFYDQAKKNTSNSGR